jgi:hypothetical protein
MPLPRAITLAVPVLLAFGALASSGAAAPPFYADYDRELREPAPRPDGINHVDTPALVARLLELNATTYAFLLYHQPSDYSDLADEFLPAAEQAGIEVWAYLVPPTELPGDYPPCQGDYVCWGQLMGELAAAHPALTTIVMDDFNGNVGLFTPAYVRQMMDAAHASAPALRFYALDYYPWLLTDFLRTDYRGAVDGIVHAYRDLDTTATLSSELDQLCLVTKGKAELRFHVPASTPSLADDYVALTKTVPVSSATASLSFDLLDSFYGPTTGFHFFQVLVDGSVVSELDVAGTEPNAHHDVDLSAAVAGKTQIALGLRLYDKQAVANFPLDLFVYGMQAAGVELGSGAWALSRHGAAEWAASPTDFQYGGDCISMIYAAATSWHAAEPTPQYLSDALTIGHDKIVSGSLDGLITYCLDKSPTSATFDTVAALYGAWRQGEGGAPADGGPPDAGPDASGGSGGTAAGGATPSSVGASCPSDDGCGCRLPGSGRGAGRGLALLLGGLLGLGRRRRRG